MQYTEKELSRLIDDVEKEFSAHLSLAKSESNSSASGESTLAKAEDDEHKEKKEHKEESAESKPESKEHEEHESEPKGEEHEEAPSEDGEAHDYDDEDLEHMHKMYMSMGKGELKAHHDAIKKCLDSQMSKCGEVEEQAPHNIKESPESHDDAEAAMGKTEIEDENPELNSKPKDNAKAMNGDKANGGIEDAAPHNALGPKSPASNANGAKINKSEHDRRNGGKIDAQAPGKIPGAKAADSDAHGDKMDKSELSPEVELLKSQVEAEKVKTENLQKSLDAVSAFLAKLVEKTAPKGKAITSLDVIAKSETLGEEVPLNKGEINSILAKKAADPTLAKADREAINAYYLDNASINSISHLLK